MYQENFFGTCLPIPGKSKRDCESTSKSCPSLPYNNIPPPNGCYQDGRA